MRWVLLPALVWGETFLLDGLELSTTEDQKNDQPIYKRLGSLRGELNEAAHSAAGGSLLTFLRKGLYCGWTKSISHHLRNPGMMIPLQITTNSGLPWFQSGAGFRPSAVKSLSSLPMTIDPKGLCPRISLKQYPALDLAAFPLAVLHTTNLNHPAADSDGLCRSFALGFCCSGGTGLLWLAWGWV